MPKVSHQCPSNIALVKYWGKKGLQLPANPSLSFTLSASYTQMEISYEPKEYSKKIETSFLFEGKPNEKFKAKIDTFLASQSQTFPFLHSLHLAIQSANSFPHSAGIASSASSMGALALCLCSIEKEIVAHPLSKTDYLRKASFVARLASGSACRSVFPHLALWGHTPLLANSSDEYAVALTDFDPVFKTYQNRILIVSASEKAVSSRAGHALMTAHPFATARYAQAQQNIEKLLSALQTGDLALFGEITENEALTLHALMMNSQPSVVLMQPNSLVLIEKIRKFRADTQLPVYFTLDAGPNIHLLFPQAIATTVDAWVQQELTAYCENGKVIVDAVGE
jgi:diphosphomevalonate decarboxylase